MADQTIVQSDATLFVEGGGSATHALVSAGGTLIGDGTVDNAEIIGGIGIVTAGAVWTNANVHDLGTLTVSSGGVTSFSTTSEGGGEIVENGGSSMIADICDNGGYQIVSSGGYGSGSVVEEHGETSALSGSLLSSYIVLDDGIIFLQGSAAATDIGDSGHLEIS
ncbi:MAG: hypothetical protein JF605_25295, partial [Burkholderia sp.]|nr:hypothetical protein [Burkholderia sp.]